MAVKLKTLLFILVLGTGVVSGVPLQGSEMGMNKEVCPMKCCEKAAKSSKAKRSNESSYLCRVLVCSQTTPSNTASVVQVNFVPVIVASERKTIFEVIEATKPKGLSVRDVDAAKSPTELPRYLLHQRILV